MIDFLNSSLPYSTLIYEKKTFISFRHGRVGYFCALSMRYLQVLACVPFGHGIQVSAPACLFEHE